MLYSETRTFTVAVLTSAAVWLGACGDDYQPSRGKSGCVGATGYSGININGFDTRIYLPESYSPQQKYPTVVSLPGWVVSHSKQDRVFPLQKLTGRKGAILLVPQSTATHATGWNLNNPVSGFNTVMKGITQLTADSSCPGRSLDGSSVDLSRLVVAGHSAGARAAYMIAAGRPDHQPAGVLAFGGDGSGADLTGGSRRFENPARPTFLIHIHGDRDGLVNYNGGKRTFESYVRSNQCSGTDQQRSGRYTLFQGRSCSKPTSMFSINGGGHEANLEQLGVLEPALDKMMENLGAGGAG